MALHMFSFVITRRKFNILFHSSFIHLYCSAVVLNSLLIIQKQTNKKSFLLDFLSRDFLLFHMNAYILYELTYPKWSKADCVISYDDAKCGTDSVYDK